MPVIKIVISEEGFAPVRASEGASCHDILAARDEIVPAGQARLIATGIRMEVPEGWEVQIRSRSGLGLKRQIHVINSPGTIDSDYRDEVGVILMNSGQDDFAVRRGDRIAQMRSARAERDEFVPVDEIGESSSRSGGFGSTGVSLWCQPGDLVRHEKGGEYRVLSIRSGLFGPSVLDGEVLEIGDIRVGAQISRPPRPDDFWVVYEPVAPYGEAELPDAWGREIGEFSRKFTRVTA